MTDRPAAAKFGRLADWMGRILLLALALLLGCFEMADYDIWWHLRTGELIPTRGLPSTDWYSFTSSDNAWIDVHWLFQLLMAETYRRAGAGGIVLLKAVVATIAVALGLAAYRRDWPASLQLGVWVPALFLLSSRIYERPETLTMLFTAAFLFVFFHAERRPRLLWLLPPIQILWANCHGLFVFGPVLLAMYLVETVFRMDRVQKVFRHLIPVTLLVAVGCLCSPYTFQNIELVVELWRKMSGAGKLYRENIAELVDIASFWRHGGYESPFVWLLFFLLGLSAASCVIGWRAILLDRRLLRPLALGAFGWLALKATRNGNHFALVAGTMVSWNLAEAGWRWPHRLASRLSAMLLVAAAGWFVASDRWYLLLGGTRQTRLGERPYYYSKAGMRIAGLRGMPERAAVFHIGHAAQYIYENGPERKVYMDGRLEVHSFDQFRDYLVLHDSFHPGGDWDGRLRHHGIDLVIADGEHNPKVQAALFAHSRWRCVYYDSVLGVFVRREAPLPAEAREFEFRESLWTGHAARVDEKLPSSEPWPARWLFAPPEVHREASDFAAERAMQLVHSLQPYGQAPPTFLASLRWYLLTQAIDALKRRPFSAANHRFVAAGFMFLAGPSEETSPCPPIWEDPARLFRAAAIYRFQRALACDEEDFSANFLLQQCYRDQRAMPLALPLLERLVARRPRTHAQIEMTQILPEVLEAVRATVNERATTLGTGGDPLGARELSRREEAGLLGPELSGLDPASVLSLETEEADSVAGRLLAIGKETVATAVYRDMATTGKLPAAKVAIRLAACAFVRGDFPEGKAQYSKALDLDSVSGSANTGLAILAALAGDLDSFRRYVEQGKSAHATPAERTFIEEIGRIDMAPH